MMTYEHDISKQLGYLAKACDEPLRSILRSAQGHCAQHEGL